MTASQNTSPRPDIVVRGAGIFGLTCAWAMVRRGARVVVVDPGGPGAGASGGIVGALAPHVPENWNPKKAFQLESLLMAGAFWAEVTRQGGLDAGYARSGRLQPLPDAASVARAKVRAVTAADLWQGHARWEVTGPLPGVPGHWHPHSPTGLYIHDTLSARLHPRRAVDALAAALRAQGVAIVPDAEAPPGARTLWATGVAGLRALDVARPSVKGQAVLLAHDARSLPQVFVDGLHIIPHGDGTVAIGSTSEPDRDDLGTDAQCDTLVARARAALPVLDGAHELARWAGLRPRAPSRAPLLGAWPGRPGHYVANGGFKIGFGMAPKVGEVMADLILDGTDSVPEGFGFSPERGHA